jgi:hypothetical protein
MSDNLDKEASKFDAAIAKLMSGTTGARTRKASRKPRAKKIISETDRRRLRATGGVEQWKPARGPLGEHDASREVGTGPQRSQGWPGV